jgi:hypothetical protein
VNVLFDLIAAWGDMDRATPGQRVVVVALLLALFVAASVRW